MTAAHCKTPIEAPPISNWKPDWNGVFVERGLTYERFRFVGLEVADEVPLDVDGQLQAERRRGTGGWVWGLRALRSRCFRV